MHLFSKYDLIKVTWGYPFMISSLVRPVIFLTDLRKKNRIRSITTREGATITGQL
jgi:hypothetical protein